MFYFSFAPDFSGVARYTGVLHESLIVSALISSLFHHSTYARLFVYRDDVLITGRRRAVLCDSECIR